MDNTKKLKIIFLKIFSELKPESFDFDMPRTKFENWDSLAHLQLISEIENDFNIRFEIDDVVEINSPADFLNLINKKTVKQ